MKRYRNSACPHHTPCGQLRKFNFPFSSPEEKHRRKATRRPPDATSRRVYPVSATHANHQASAPCSPSPPSSPGRKRRGRWRPATRIGMIGMPLHPTGLKPAPGAVRCHRPFERGPGHPPNMSAGHAKKRQAGQAMKRYSRARVEVTKTCSNGKAGRPRSTVATRSKCRLKAPARSRRPSSPKCLGPCLPECNRSRIEARTITGRRWSSPL